VARSRVLDMMQAFPFWLFDVSGVDGNVLFSVLDPALGFSSITAPEITIETRDVQPGNWEFKHRIVKTADVGAVTLARGARFYDSDFYNWITNAIVGRQPLRRNLALVHFMSFRPQSQLTGANMSFPDVGFIQSGLRVPGRAWMLYNCIPTRYKAGSDFDAAASEVSIQELEIQPEHISELTLATLSPGGARAISSGIAIGNAVT
jgi:phage tail-like protein